MTNRHHPELFRPLFLRRIGHILTLLVMKLPEHHPPLLQPTPHNSLIDELKAAQKEYDKAVGDAKKLAKFVAKSFSYLHQCKKNIPFISSIVEMNHFTYAAYALIPPISKAANHIHLFRNNSLFKSKLDSNSIAQVFNQTTSQSETAASTALQPERISAQAGWI